MRPLAACVVLALAGCSTAGKVGEAAEAARDAIPVVAEAVPEVRQAVAEAREAVGWVRERQGDLDDAARWGWRIAVAGLLAAGAWQHRRWRRAFTALQAVTDGVERAGAAGTAVKRVMAARYGGSTRVRTAIRSAKRAGPPE